jgi:hypothetical protein
MNQLCAAIAVEQDGEKFTALVKELQHLLEAEEARLREACLYSGVFLSARILNMKNHHIGRMCCVASRTAMCTRLLANVQCDPLRFITRGDMQEVWWTVDDFVTVGAPSFI